ncbi:BTAD domain-containing putative transcriptional regulator [Streptomyces sp. H39-S7]|uniref:BTAD domain-containing putative transcriptional regulator n=1 Tax=Streptomyces sp. H39-S7 TaxID=3004357 RepID=UPI0022AFD37C|nr:BTAD domain-containing putative transcriptional regulator [Streptomyces sp. H39-S7]MCZ4123174.1 BTAD domain-containing putative transcriptional regulator [Streptomyces sp. H39-S7]
MRYAILGSTQAFRDDGTPVPLAGLRLRALLTALALRPGRLITAESLIDELWGDGPPANATGALQALVARLRRAIGHDAIGSADGGYRLCAAPEAVDAHRFERLVDEGGRALADGDPVKASDLLEDALALWRGAAFADLPDRDTLAVRCEELRLEAVRLRLTAGLALGRAERQLPELAGLAAAHPLNESIRALHIRALRDAGRTADALSAYEDVRRDLADELGTDPSAELRALHTELLAPETGRGPSPTADAGVATGPPSAPASRRSGNARARLTSFVGRAAELTAIRADLATARLVTLTGPGGTGKTRLSQETGDLLADRWPDGVWYAELAPVSDPRTVPEAVLTSLGLRETLLHPGSATEQALSAEGKTKDPARALAEYCAGRSLLLVLDNCEHVIDAAAALAEQLLAHCPGVTVLATSREPLGVPGERVRPLDPLPDPFALKLLADRGAAARPGFTVEDDPVACAELCRRLDGLPLAIELAAARLRSLTPRQLADRLDDRFRLLTGGSRTVLPRQQTLRAVVDWSWDLLDPAERTLLRRLAVFAGGWTLEAVEEVCSGDGIDAADAPALLGSLVDKSLVLADLTDDGARYRMLETIGEYAAERLDESGERAVVERRHLRCFREYIRTADPELRGADQLLWLARLEHEHENLRTALRRAVELGDEQEALQLVLACGWFWEMRNYHTEQMTWPAAVAALGPDPFDEPALLEPMEHGPLDTPPPMGPAQLDEARRWVRMMQLVTNGGDVENRWGDPDMARVGRAIIDAYPPHLPQSARRPGLMSPFAAFLSGEFERMPELVDNLVVGCRAFGGPWELAFALQIRAKMLNDVTEKLEQSMADVRESRELFRQVGDRWGMAEALAAEAEATANSGQWERSAECCREAITMARELGSYQMVPLLNVRLGDMIINTGDAKVGEALLRAAIVDADEVGPAAGGSAFYGRVLLCALLGRRGELDEGHAIIDGMLVSPPVGVPLFVTGMLRGIKGWLTCRSGDPVGGLRYLREGLDELTATTLTEVIAPRIGMLLVPVAVTILVARASSGATPREQAAMAARAATLLGAHDRLRPTVPSPLEREELADGRRDLVALLGDAAFESAYAEGDGLSAVETIALMRVED